MGKWESGIVDEGVRRLKKYKDVKLIKIHGSAFQQRGTPDLIGCSSGKCVVVEVKNEEGRLSDIQVQRLNEWCRAGAVGAAVRSPEEIVNAFLYRTGNWEAHDLPTF
jgi:Holliday junction resolvase